MIVQLNVPGHLRMVHKKARRAPLQSQPIKPRYFTPPPRLLVQAKVFPEDQFLACIQGCGMDDVFKTDAAGSTIIDYIFLSLCPNEQLEKLKIVFNKVAHSFDALCDIASRNEMQFVNPDQPTFRRSLLLVTPSHLVYAIKNLSLTHNELLLKHALDYGLSMDLPEASKIQDALSFTDQQGIKELFSAVDFGIDSAKKDAFQRSSSVFSLLSNASTIDHDAIAPEKT